MLPWGRWVIICGTIFEVKDWDIFEEFATLETV